jgi:cytochrome c oxidase cbb3-type subunit 3
MAAKDIDALTGTETTGHEWDGLKELNTPLPKWWLYVFYATILFSVGYTIAFPAWPSLSGYTRGVLGYSSRESLRNDLAALRAERAVWLDRFETASVDDIAADPELQRFAMAGGRAIFADNCAPCHGAGGAGARGYPILADDDWIWGGTRGDIHQTIVYGIRNGHDEARIAEMPAYGADGILERADIAAVAEHVLSLSGAAPANTRGAEIFAENCVACHGEDGKGMPEQGGPNLTDGIWLYGGGREAVIAQITKPRLGVMPVWQGRLDPASIKQVAIYVHSLGGGQE